MIRQFVFRYLEKNLTLTIQNVEIYQFITVQLSYFYLVMYIYTTTAYENILKVVYNNELNGIVIKKNKMTFVVVTFQ